MCTVLSQRVEGCAWYKPGERLEKQIEVLVFLQCLLNSGSASCCSTMFAKTVFNNLAGKCKKSWQIERGRLSRKSNCFESLFPWWRLNAETVFVVRLDSVLILHEALILHADPVHNFQSHTSLIILEVQPVPQVQSQSTVLEVKFLKHSPESTVLEVQSWKYSRSWKYSHTRTVPVEESLKYSLTSTVPHIILEVQSRKYSHTHLARSIVTDLQSW